MAAKTSSQDATAEEEGEFDEEEGEYDGWALQSREEQVLKHLPFGGWLGPGNLRLLCSYEYQWI